MADSPLEKPLQHKLCYINGRGKRVEIAITKHARLRFIERWRCIYPLSDLSFESADSKIQEWFSKAQRLEPRGKRLTHRLKKHGKDTLYFRFGHFTFIVQDAALLTVEISEEGKRHLNRIVPSKMQNVRMDPPTKIYDKYPGIDAESEKQEPIGKTDCEKAEAVKIQVPLFRLTAIVELPEGTRKCVSLGTHEPWTSQADPQRLVAQPAFASLVRARSSEKCPKGRLLGVIICLGKKQDHVLFCPLDQLAS